MAGHAEHPVFQDLTRASGAAYRGLTATVARVRFRSAHQQLARQKARQQKAFAGVVQSLPALRTTAKDRPEFTTPPWRDWALRLDTQLLPDLPFAFLRHPLIRATMFVATGGRMLWRERRYLRSRLDEPRLRSILEEDYVGEPTLFDRQLLTSHHSIHQLYHLERFTATTGVRLQPGAKVIEWGGGYGNCAKLILRLCSGQATYVIVDLPPLCILQWTYLASILGRDQVNFVAADRPRVATDKVNIVPVGAAEACAGMHGCDLFVSTWAISESSRNAQDFVVDRSWMGAEHLLLAYQRDPGLFPDAGRVGDLARANGARIEEVGVLGHSRYAFR